MARCPVKRLDPGACIDFSTKGLLVTDKFRDGWDKIFKKKLPPHPDAHADRFK